MYTLVLIVGFFSTIALIGYQLKIERENEKIRNASRSSIATLIDPPTTQFGRMTKLFFILGIPIAGLICLLVLTRDDLAKYNKAREVTATSVNVKTVEHMVLGDGVLIFNTGSEYQTVNVSLNGIMFGSYKCRNVIVPPNGSVSVSFRECINRDGERFDSYRKKPTEIYVF